MQVDAHPPCVSHSFAYSVGIVDDVEMRQGSTLWSPSRALVKKKKNIKKLITLFRKTVKLFNPACDGYSDRLLLLLSKHSEANRQSVTL